MKLLPPSSISPAPCGVRRQSALPRRSAAEAGAATALSCAPNIHEPTNTSRPGQSGVALRLPPQSKIRRVCQTREPLPPLASGNPRFSIRHSLSRPRFRQERHRDFAISNLRFRGIPAPFTKVSFFSFHKTLPPLTGWVAVDTFCPSLTRFQEVGTWV
jgi:hypothetical protein